jgi:phage shock protein E
MKPVVIDVREKSEYENGHVEGAINIPSSELLDGAQVLSRFSKETPLILYCRSGARSAIALNMLKSLGFTNMTNGINQENVERHLFSA